jgi:alkane 1-monooxygenase
MAMGLMCGVMGINIGHELGHRTSRREQFLGEILLLTSLNTHFLPYHNEGHHREVATPDDPATAKKGQWLFVFWITSHFGSYVKAWRIENNRMRKNGKSVFSLSNRMVSYSLANIALLFSIYYFFNVTVLFAFILSSVVGILLLETVNYIEHYGLLRERNSEGRYERVKRTHSWNSDHQIGRLMLFNLSRHSDHHYKSSKKYQVLESLEESPQMPTGYPGMMLLALFQPVWFAIMDKKLIQ